MLKQLSVQNIAVAENLNVEFENGLNIITGETGAGKSILVDALALLRGGKVQVSLIRDGAESALVSAQFYVLATAGVLRVMSNHGIPMNPDDMREVSIRRVLQRTGKHRAFVNDVQVNSKTLQNISAELIDISSQFDNQRLLESDSHTRYLDHFVGSLDLYSQFLKSFELCQTLLGEARSLEQDIALRKRERSLFEFELQQIEEANLSESEFVKVKGVVQLGNKAQSAQRLCSEIADQLNEGDHNLLSGLRICKKNVEKLQRLAVSQILPVRVEHVDEAIACVETLVENVEAARSEFEIDDELISVACERLEIYNRILQKFGPDLSDVFDYREKCSTFLNQSSNFEERFKALLKTTASAITEATSLARTLGIKRREGVKKLSGCIQKEMSELGMPRALFVCSLVNSATHSPDSIFSKELVGILEASVLSSFLKLSRFGLEHAHFLMSTNAGLDPQAIEKVASGGELSRTMLAIKSVLFENDVMSVFVFDEIDTGISGNIAAKVGKKLCEFCQTRQVICITHLPQVACFSSCHFIVSKTIVKNRTVAFIKRANPDEKLKELASMLSGETVTKESIAHARSLVVEAKGMLL